jgi:aspartate/methionine/tyrosine aminotransferase
MRCTRHAGSGFGQEEGTYHFRTTFLPQEDAMEKVIKLMGKFQAEFMAKYA